MGGREWRKKKKARNGRWRREPYSERELAGERGYCLGDNLDLLWITWELSIKALTMVGIWCLMWHKMRNSQLANSGFCKVIFTHFKTKTKWKSTFSKGFNSPPFLLMALKVWKMSSSSLPTLHFWSTVPNSCPLLFTTCQTPEPHTQPSL